MSTATPPTPASAPSHGKRLLTLWIVSAVILTPIVVWLAGTFIPPGNQSEQATQQVYDNQWIVAVITPVVLLMIVFFGYTLTTFRVRDGDDGDGPQLRGDRGIQLTWICVTSAAALMLAVVGPN